MPYDDEIKAAMQQWQANQAETQQAMRAASNNAGAYKRYAPPTSLPPTYAAYVQQPGKADQVVPFDIAEMILGMQRARANPSERLPDAPKQEPTG